MAAFGKQFCVLLLLAICAGCAGSGTGKIDGLAVKSKQPFQNHPLRREPVLVATNVARPLQVAPVPRPVHHDPEIIPADFTLPSPMFRGKLPQEPVEGIVFVEPNSAAPIPSPPHIAVPEAAASPVQPATTWITPESIPPLIEEPEENPIEAEPTDVRSTKQLELRNLCFCREIDSFGVYKQFESTTFEPGQQVLLYVEVEGFQSESKPGGYCTSLTSAWSVQNEEGDLEAERTYPPAKDICRNQRRDFFQAFRFHLPSSLKHGAYELVLEVRDSLSKQTAQAQIPFRVAPTN